MAVRSHLTSPDVASLYATEIAPNQTIFLMGNTTLGDQTVKWYKYDGTSTATDDGDNVIKPTSVMGAGRYIKLTDNFQIQSDWSANSGVAAILNKPSLATVATSGNYNDLSNKPTIPAAQVNSDWNANSGVAQILNKPTLATVATSGSYGDLGGTPSLATVATSGSYNDLSNKPTIPAAQVQADWAQSSSGAVDFIKNKPTIPSAFTVGTPTSRSISLATAYQASDTTAPAVVTINLNSTASLSLSGGTTIIGEVRIGSANTVASGASGTAVGTYKNSLTGTLTIGLNIQTDNHNNITFLLPAGWYFAVRQTTGSGLTVVSAFDQKVAT